MAESDNDGRPQVLDPKDVPLASSDYAAFFPAGITYPLAGRDRRQLGVALGLTQFGVNQVRLSPGAWSSLRHWHIHEDEFVYVLAGELTLVSEAGRHTLKAGQATGFPAGHANGHHLINEGAVDAVFLEVGRRAESDTVFYPDADLVYSRGPWGRQFRHENGESY